MQLFALLMNRHARSTAALALVTALGSACGEPADPSAGVLVIPYELGNRKDCDSVGVRIVRAELDDPMYVEEALCGAGEIRFSRVPPGAYSVRLFGIDREGVAVMDSLQAGDVPVSVIGDGVTVKADPAIMLTAAPAHLLLRWSFGFGTCESAAIDRFAVTAWRADGSALLLEAQVPCATPGQGAEQYRAVPDAERDLSGDEVGEVSVQPLDKHGIELGEPTIFQFDAPGAGRNVKLSLTCADGSCVGTGRPD